MQLYVNGRISELLAESVKRIFPSWQFLLSFHKKEMTVYPICGGITYSITLYVIINNRDSIIDLNIVDCIALNAANNII